MIAVLRQTVARGLLGLFGQDPNTHSAQTQLTSTVAVKPAAAFDDGTIDEPSPYRDDATAAAARRLLDFHLGA